MATPFVKCNFGIYYGPLATIMGVSPSSLDGAAELVARYDRFVMGVQAGVDRTNAQRILAGVKKLNPNFKWYGYTTLGGAASYAAWNTAMNQWASDFASPVTPDGIFIDQFGTDWPLSTRTNQNQAVTDTHAAGYGALVNPFDPMTALDTVAAEAAPVLGTHATLVDGVLLESYYQSNQTPTLEEPNKRLLRAWRMQQAQSAKLDGYAVVGTGGAVNLSVSAWDLVRRELAAYGIRYLAVGNSDYGSASHNAYLGPFANVLWLP